MRSRLATLSLLLLVSSVLFFSANAADIFVTSDLDAVSTFWGAGDRWIIQNDIALLPGSELIIQESTVVQLDPGVTFTIQGRINATGGPLSHITIESSSSTSSWNEIRFASSGADAPTLGPNGEYISGPIMSYVDVRDGGDFGQCHFVITGAAPYMEALTFDAPNAAGSSGRDTSAVCVNNQAYAGDYSFKDWSVVGSAILMQRMTPGYTVWADGFTCTGTTYSQDYRYFFNADGGYGNGRVGGTLHISNADLDLNNPTSTSSTRGIYEGAWNDESDIDSDFVFVDSVVYNFGTRGNLGFHYKYDNVVYRNNTFYCDGEAYFESYVEWYTDIAGLAQANLVIEDNLFVDIGGIGIYHYFYHDSVRSGHGGNIIFRGNTLTGLSVNGYPFYFEQHCELDCSMVVTDNEFVDIVDLGGTATVIFYKYSDFGGDSAVTEISGNVFRNITTYKLLDFYEYCWNCPYEAVNLTHSIFNNTITENTIESTLMYFYSTDTVEMYFNAIYDNEVSGALIEWEESYDYDFESSPDAWDLPPTRNLSMNYWGGFDPTVDSPYTYASGPPDLWSGGFHYSSGQQRQGIFTPLLANPGGPLDGSSVEPQLDTCLRSDPLDPTLAYFGCFLFEDTVIDASTWSNYSRILVDRTIYVTENATLTLTGPLTLEVMPYRNIIVEGAIIVNATSTERVHIVSSDPDYTWGGFLLLRDKSLDVYENGPNGFGPSSVPVNGTNSFEYLSVDRCSGGRDQTSPGACFNTIRRSVLLRNVHVTNSGNVISTQQLSTSSSLLDGAVIEHCEFRNISHGLFHSRTFNRVLGPVYFVHSYLESGHPFNVDDGSYLRNISHSTLMPLEPGSLSTCNRLDITDFAPLVTNNLTIVGVPPGECSLNYLGSTAPTETSSIYLRPTTISNYWIGEDLFFDLPNADLAVRLYSTASTSPSYVSRMSLTGGAMSIEVAGSGTAPLLCDQCLFRDINSPSGGWQASGSTGTPPNEPAGVTNSVFRNVTGPSVVSFGTTVSEDYDGYWLVQGCDFLDNTVTGPVINAVGHSAISTPGFDLVDSNLFANNTCDTEVLAYRSSLQINNNIFLDSPTSGFLLRASPLDSNAVIDATKNYWGSAHDNSTAIDPLLEDIFDSSSLPFVSIFPWLQSTNSSDLAVSDGASASSIVDNVTSTIQGIALGEELLTLEGSPWTVPADVIIGGTGSLTVEAGVELRIAPGVSIKALGAIKFLGNETHWIECTSTIASPTSRSHHWAGMFVVGAQTELDAQGQYVSGSVIQYTRLSYSGGTISGETPVFTSVASDVLLDHVDIQYPRHRGFYLNPLTTLNVRALAYSNGFFDTVTSGASGSVFLNVLEGGGVVDGLTTVGPSTTSSSYSSVHFTTGDWNVTGVDILNGGQYGLYFFPDVTGHVFRLSDSHFDNARSYAMYFRDARAYVSDTIVRNCPTYALYNYHGTYFYESPLVRGMQLFVDGLTVINTRYGVSYQANSSGRYGTVDIRNSVLRDYSGSSQILLGSSSYYPSYLNFVNNTVDNWSSSSSYSTGLVVSASAAIDFSNNTITGCAWGYELVFVGGISCSAGSLDLVGNSLVGNPHLGSFESHVIDFNVGSSSVSCPGWTITANAFDNPSWDYEISTPAKSSLSIPSLSLLDNYWGEPVTGAWINSRVFDLLEDSSRLLADVSSACAFANCSSLVDIGSDGIAPTETDLKGILAEGTLSLVDVDIAMTGSLIVLSGATLELGPNVTITASDGVSFVIFGNVSAAGTADHPVRIVTESFANWGGFFLYDEPNVVPTVYDENYNYISGPRFHHVHVEHCGNTDATDTCWFVARPMPSFKDVHVVDPFQYVIWNGLRVHNDTKVFENMSVTEFPNTVFYLSNYQTDAAGVHHVFKNITTTNPASSAVTAMRIQGPDMQYLEPFTRENVILIDGWVSDGLRTLLSYSDTGGVLDVRNVIATRVNGQGFWLGAKQHVLQPWSVSVRDSYFRGENPVDDGVGFLYADQLVYWWTDYLQFSATPEPRLEDTSILFDNVEVRAFIWLLQEEHYDSQVSFSVDVHKCRCDWIGDRSSDPGQAVSVSMSGEYPITVSVTDSTFVDCGTPTTSTIDIVGGSTFTGYLNATVVGNRFENSSTPNIIRIIAADAVDPDIVIADNTFKDSTPVLDVSVTANHGCGLDWQGNVFVGGFPSARISVSGNCTSDPIDVRNSWWNGLNGTDVGTTALSPGSSFIWDPILDSFSCAGVNECSGNGTCVFVDTCECFPGVIGAACDAFECDFDCYGNGTCIAPNLCDCDSGYSGNLCQFPACDGVNECNGNGVCIDPNVCLCDSTFDGAACDSCDSTHWGYPSCFDCPACDRGSCDDVSGVCNCDVGWTGELCDGCAPRYYGANCEVITVITSVSPDSGFDVGGTTVNVFGDWFLTGVNDTVQCAFGVSYVPATVLSETHLQCVSPLLPSGDYSLEVTAAQGGLTSSGSTFTVLGLCGASDCNNNGVCAFGDCVCDYDWTGSDCTTPILVPTVTSIPNVNLDEGEGWSWNATLSSGTNAPAGESWSLVQRPSGMTINSATGEISWGSGVSSETAYTVVVRASNVVGYGETSFTVQVGFSYSMQLISITPSVAQSGSNIVIRGNSTIPQRSGTLWIELQGSVRYYNVFTLSNGEFAFVFSPATTEAGEYTIGVKHPERAGTPLDGAQTLYMYGLTTNVPAVTLQTVSVPANTTSSGLFQLRNIGDTALTGLEWSVVNPAAVESGIPELEFFSLSNFPSSLGPGADVLIDVSIVVNGTIDSKTVEVLMTSAEGAERLIAIVVDVNLPRASLSASIVNLPNLINRQVLRGYQNVFEIEIRNSGTGPTSDVTISLPLDPALSVSSGTTLSPIGIGETRVVALTVYPDAERPLAQIVGNLLFSNLADASVFVEVDFRFLMASDVTADVELLVQDEVSFYGEGNPLVDNAVCRLTNKITGERLFGSDDATAGRMVWTAIPEGIYEVLCQAPGHVQDRFDVQIVPGTNVLSAFLSRTVVSYVWSVTPTTVEDVYEFTVEADFVTNVPIPVITISPSVIPLEDLEGMECGEVRTINFDITNHGLIQAEDAGLLYPDHPWLLFSQLVDPIGNLTANSTITVPVVVTKDVNNTDVCDCSSSACVNGVCEAGRLCNCNAGWKGENCDEPRCETFGCVHGTCTDVDVCSCDSDWSGNDCNTPEPTLPTTCPVNDPDSCPENGVCVGNVWYCGTGWGGPKCCEPVCDGTIGDREECKAPKTPGQPGTKACRGRWFGAGCRHWSSNSCWNGRLDYYLECNGLRQYTQRISYTRAGPCTINNAVVGSRWTGGGGLAFGSVTYYSISPTVQADDCSTAGCLGRFELCIRNRYVGLGCGNAMSRTPWVRGTTDASAVLSSSLSSVLCPRSANGLPEYRSALKCLRELEAPCGWSLGRASGGGSRRLAWTDSIEENGSPENEAAYELMASAEQMDRLSEVMMSLFDGDDEWLGIDDEAWVGNMLAAVQDNSPGSVFVSPSEASGLLDSLPFNLDSGAVVPSHKVERLIARWNRTFEYIDAGYQSNADVPAGNSTDWVEVSPLMAEVEGLFDAEESAAVSLESDWLGDVEVFSDAFLSREAGICAKVRVQIVQELVLSRQAFDAKLEVFNDGLSGLENMFVSLYVQRFDDKSNATELFSIPAPSLTGALEGSGTGSTWEMPWSMGGVLTNNGESGVANWLIIPFEEAVPGSEAIFYEVGGTFSYELDGFNITVPLWPDSIEVFPDPKLFLRYFWEEEVFGDDPFTENVIEPSVPFVLGVQVINSGFGAARDVRLSSGQPEIIENEKGLLVSFGISSSDVNGLDATPSLTVDFGDVVGQSVGTARWWMTASLQGRFQNFDATFEHVTDLGDPRLGLVDGVEIYGLEHSVRIDEPSDDGIPDFFANNITTDTVGDRIFGSELGQELAVEFVDASGVVAVETPVSAAEVDVTFTIDMSGVSDEWVYIRLVDPQPIANALVWADRVGVNGKRLHEDNVWRTSRIRRPVGGSEFTEKFVHIVDRNSTGVYTLRVTRLDPVTGLAVIGETNTTETRRAVTLSWDAAPYALKYAVAWKYASEQDSAFRTVDAFVTVPTYTISGLYSGSDYVFIVYAGAQDFEDVGSRVSHTTSGDAPNVCFPECIAGQGECTGGVGGSCACFDGWSGESCADPVCDPECQLGTCVAPDECQCDSDPTTGEAIGSGPLCAPVEEESAFETLLIVGGAGGTAALFLCVAGARRVRRRRRKGSKSGKKESSEEEKGEDKKGDSGSQAPLVAQAQAELAAVNAAVKAAEAEAAALNAVVEEKKKERRGSRSRSRSRSRGGGGSKGSKGSKSGSKGKRRSSSSKKRRGSGSGSGGSGVV